MDLRKHFLEAATLIAAAVICALVANAFASRERKIAVVGSYSNATSVPARTPEPTPRVVSTETITTAVDVTATAAPVPTPAPPAITTTQAAPKPAPATETRAPQSAAASTNATTHAANPVAPKHEDLLTRFPPHDKQPYVEIHGDDVAWLHKQGVLFLDARRTSVYEDGHIPGARPFSVWEADIDDKVRKLFDERGDPKQQLQPIVVYCSGGDCEDSHMLAEKLWGAQFNNVYVYKDGFPDWQKRGEPVHKGNVL